jgi:hypothetical protein
MDCTFVFTDWFFTDMSWLVMDAERAATQLNPTPPHFLLMNFFWIIVPPFLIVIHFPTLS